MSFDCQRWQRTGGRHISTQVYGQASISTRSRIVVLLSVCAVDRSSSNDVTMLPHTLDSPIKTRMKTLLTVVCRHDLNVDVGSISDDMFRGKAPSNLNRKFPSVLPELPLVIY